MPNQQACDSTAIALFLDDKLDSVQLAEFASHLESCADCQSAVDNAAADQRFWNEAISHLACEVKGSADGLDDHGPTQTDVREGEEALHESQPLQHSIRNVLSALAPTDDPEMLGRIGEYEISGVVGIGGMGAVLKGFDKSLMRVVAIKVMAPHLAHKGSARKRFEREARAAAAISNDNVCDIYRVDELNGLPYLVMPFARGPSLQRRIDESGPLSTIEVVLVGKQIASGLAAAHEQGLVHRDIKPANILLNDGIERILITDFGVARAMDDVSMTQTGLIAGTPLYMSPEQARGEVVDQRSDLFSLGALLYTVCTGRPPFRAEVPFGILRKITDAQPRSIMEINPEIPIWLVAAIERLLEKQPSRRFESAKDVADLFEKCLAHLRQPNQIALPQTIAELSVQTQAQLPVKPQNEQKRNLPKWLRIAALFLGLTAFGAFGFFQFTQAPDISGNWNGEHWNEISLRSVEETDDWYAGRFVDTNGKDGAIHLEWSRLERRYKGRWSVDSDSTGAIVLRKDGSHSVCGAIMLDSDANSKSAVDQLRDFVWRPGSGETSVEPQAGDDEPSQLERQRLTDARNSHGESVQNSRARNILAPKNGIITRAADGIVVGSKVSKGDFLFEFTPLSANIEQVKKELKFVEDNLSALPSYLESFGQKLKDAREAQDLAVELASEKAKAAEARFESLRAKLTGFSAKLRQKQQEFKRVKKLHSAGQKTQSESAKAEAEYITAKSDLESATNEVEVLKRDWNVATLNIESVRRQTQCDIDDTALSQQQTAEQIAELQKRKSELQQIQSELDTLIVSAPADGTITYWLENKRGNPINEGVVVLEITSEDSQQQSDLQDEFSSEASSTNSPNTRPEFRIGSISEMMKFASGLQQTLRMLGGKISDTGERLNMAEETITKLEEQINAEVAKLNELKASSSDDNSEAAAKLQSKINGNRSDLVKRKTQLDQLQRKLEEYRLELSVAKREKNVTLRILKLELESASSQTAQTKKALDLQRAMFEQGDANIQDVSNAEERHVSAKTNLEQLNVLLDYLSQN